MAARRLAGAAVAAAAAAAAQNTKKTPPTTQPSPHDSCGLPSPAAWSQGSKDEDEEDEGALGAFSCLRAIATVLDSVSSLPEIFPSLEECVFPLLQRHCSQEGMEVFEEVTELISYFTFFPAQVGLSPELLFQTLNLLTCPDGSLFVSLHQ